MKAISPAQRDVLAFLHEVGGVLLPEDPALFRLATLEALERRGFILRQDDKWGTTWRLTWAGHRAFRWPIVPILLDLVGE